MKLVELLKGKYRVTTREDKKDTYVLISDYKGITTEDSEPSAKRKNIETTIIFIDKGVWQYRFLNTHPVDKKYVSCEQYIDEIVTALNEAVGSNAETS